MTDSEPTYRIYTSEEGAERLGGKVVKASTLYRLARKKLVDCTRNGRKIGWTDQQLQGVVDYLTTKGSSPIARGAETKQQKRTTSPEPVPAQADIRPLETKRGSRYAADAQSPTAAPAPPFNRDPK